jgi:hypothetical protein
MAFIIDDTTVVSFAEYSDVTALDQRLFDSNEGLTDDVVEAALIKATARLVNKISTTTWWRNYYMKRDSSLNYTTVADVPSLDIERIQSRKDDFTELCVCTAMADYILPQVADFGDETNSERAKMGYYQNRAERLFEELIEEGDWYDFDNDSTIESTENDPGYVNLRRVR